jgi:hypothetical protein
MAAFYLNFSVAIRKKVEPVIEAALNQKLKP